MVRETHVGECRSESIWGCGGIFLGSVSQIIVVLECRNAEGSVFGDESGFCLGDFLQWKSF